MKKLLSLLTISGTAMPMVVAASPYKKQEKLNSDINYLQTNNLVASNMSELKRENYYVTQNGNVGGLYNFSKKINAIEVVMYSGGNRKNGDVYLGTDEGLYYVKYGTNNAIKIDNIKIIL